MAVKSCICYRIAIIEFHSINMCGPLDFKVFFYSLESSFFFKALKVKFVKRIHKRPKKSIKNVFRNLKI